MVHDSWVEVDISALKHNFRQVRGIVADATRIMAVVKGFGYGHGLVGPAGAFAEAGADALAVTHIDEAQTIRQAGVTTPILLFAPIQSENAEAAIEADLSMTVCDADLAAAISSASHKRGKPATVWLKVDTGMGRLGALPNDVNGILTAIHALPNIRVGGIYTHFATSANPDLGPTQAQLHRFKSLITSLQEAQIDYGLASAANSAAIQRLPDSHLDAVRPGTLLYGQYPSAHVPHSLDLKPTWRLKTRICQVRDLPKGARIGYGGEYATTRPTRTAILPIGYADGYTLAPEGPIYRQSLLKFLARKTQRSLSVTIRGKRAPVLGRVAMQLTVVDVTDIEGVHAGDEAIVPAMRIPTSPLIPRVCIES